MGKLVGKESGGGSSEGKKKNIQKSYFDVLGICCPSEVPLIEKILTPLGGVHKVNVIVPSRTVIVVHDTSLISNLEIVKALNQARLEASVRLYGANKIINKWPSLYIVICGLLLLVSLFHRFFQPLRWLALAAVVIGLYPIILRSIASIRRCNLDINILMLIAVGGAVALRDYSEAGFIVFLFTIAEWLENRASSKATAGMSALMSMAPQKAILAETGQVVDACDVMVNTILAVKAGEVIPIDGIVVEGRSEINEQSLTGESFPVSKQAESLVWAGTLNIDGYISVKTTALAEDSAVSRMAKLVEEAQNSRSNTQRLIDSSAKYYTPAVVVIAAGVAVIPLILRAHNPRHWLQLALVLLVSACPCALVLSTPVATFCALLTAAKTGLLVKGGDVLEALAGTRVVAFDKTGTITKGEFTVIELCPIGCQVTLNPLLYWVSSIEAKSSHPMASALVDHARSNSVEPKPEIVSDFEIYPGEGVSGVIDGKKIYIGNKKIATRVGCEAVPSTESMKAGITEGYVFLGKEPIGAFTLTDTCRTGAAEAIRELKSLGVKTTMLTGDSTAAAIHTQNQLGNVLEELHAELLPADKVRIINELKAKEGPTTMVGDGMNDAPALAASNVGISMGISGSAVAMESSHITMMSNDILKIPKAIRLARKTRNKIIVNIFFSVATKVAILALAIAGHPLLWAAVLADVGTCLLVILNSMMLLQTSVPKVEKKCRRSSHAHHEQGHNHTNCCAKSNCGSADRAPACCQKADCGEDLSGVGHKEHVHGPVHLDKCSRGGSQAPDHVSCCQEISRKATYVNHEDIISASCQHHGHNAHEHKIHKSDHATSCTRATNTSHEHVVVIGGEEEHHVNSEDNKCNDAPENTEVDGCCQTVIKECGKRDCCSSSSKLTTEETKDVCCKSDEKESGVTEEKRESVDCRMSGRCRNAGEKIETGVTCESQKKDVRGCCQNDRECGEDVEEKKKNGGCCQTERTDCGNNDCCCSPSQVKVGEKKETSRCCKSERKECGGVKKREIISCCKTEECENDGEEIAFGVCGESQKEIGGCCKNDEKCGGGRDKKDIGRCCEGERNECEQRVCCPSSSLWVAGRREINDCCKSYRKECEKGGRCCGGVVKLPEIIID